MPFSCKFQLNNGAICPSDDVRFIKFIEASFGEFHKVIVPIAEIFYNSKKAYILTNCPCFPSSQAKLESGDKLSESTIIGYFAADGEDIPYNKPFAVIQLI